MADDAVADDAVAGKAVALSVREGADGEVLPSFGLIGGVGLRGRGAGEGLAVGGGALAPGRLRPRGLNCADAKSTEVTRVSSAMGNHSLRRRTAIP